MPNEIKTCKKCGFILGTRPGMMDRDGICLSCLNAEKKKMIDWNRRKIWLTKYISECRDKNNSGYDCVVGVSGGKDSCAIVKRLVEYHGAKRLLLVHVNDEFTHSEAGKYNLDNLVRKYPVELIDFRFNPKEFVEETRKSFFEELHPLKWIEAKIWEKTNEIARVYGIPLLIMGENGAFEYGVSEECDIFHPASDEQVKIVFMGAIWPYSNTDSLQEAKKMGFRTLSEFDDWQRQGSADDFTQLDSVGYMMQHWTKFVKFGFQRVSDLACRFVREGTLTRDQAMQMIKDSDWICDPYAKKDFCRTIHISEKEFDDTVDRFANRDILIKDVNGHWRRKDLLA